MPASSPPSLASLAAIGHAARLAMPALAGPLPRSISLSPPGSKSLTNRALLLAGLAKGQSTLRRALVDADDAQRMIEALRTLGAGIEIEQAAGEGDGIIWVQGVGGRWRIAAAAQSPLLFLNNAGTATRFLTAAALLGDAPVIIDGNARMRERPIAELVESLKDCGVRVDYVGKQGFVPLRIHPLTEVDGLRIKQKTTQSSQFLSALLLLGPFLSKGITLTLEGEVTSASYVQMTLDLLAQLGASVQTSSDLRVMRVSPAEGAGAEGTGRATVPSLDGFDLAIEPDASGATYFWAAAALVPGLTCRIKGISPRSLQGDAHFAALLGRMGAVVACSEQDQERASSPWTSVTGAAVQPLPVLVDMSNMPDAAMTLASVACFAKGTSIVRGLRTLRAKETDRIKALQNELSKIGVVVRTPVADDDGAITITPPVGGVDCSPDCAPVEFDTYDDHRMAMSMAVISVRRPNCIIKDPACVAKTYPNFWTHWWQLVQGTQASG